MSAQGAYAINASFHLDLQNFHNILFPPVLSPHCLADPSTVMVILTPLNAEVEIIRRTIAFSREKYCVPVGRASKSATKGIVGAVGNAWFDSPVMSRNHAEMELNLEDMACWDLSLDRALLTFTQKLTIKDIGSMHGTFLNGIELTKNVPMAVSKGDILVFGTEVRRGSETFPACRFRVDRKILPFKTSSTFAFPESSDIEDETENSDRSSNAHIEGRRNQYSSEDGVSIDAPSQKSSQVLDPIDLTGDDFPKCDPLNSVDLTGVTESERSIVDLTIGRPADIDENTNPTSNGVYAGNLPILVDTEDEGEDVDYSSDDLSEDSGVLDDQDRLHFLEDDTDLIDNSELNSDAELVDEGNFNVASPELPVANMLTQNALASGEDPLIHISDVRTCTELPDREDGDNASDYGLSNAAAEGMKVLCDECSLMYSHNAGGSDVEDESSDESQIFGASSPRRSPATAVEPIQVSNSPTDLHLHVNPMLHAAYLDQAVSVVRHPSPSDAAMVKLPSRVSICDLGEPSHYLSQNLGEKSGKSEFFAAREINKARIMYGHHVNPTIQAADPTMSVMSGETEAHSLENRQEIGIGQLDRWKSPVFGRSQIAVHADTVMSDTLSTEQLATSFVEANEPIPSLPPRDYCEFLDKPDESPMPDHAPSSLPDMTSSHRYNMSKLFQKSSPIPRLNPRSAIKIPDIIEASSPFPRANALKRKSDDMSNATEKELREWAESNVSEVSPVAASNASAGDKTGGSISIKSQAPEPRPTKRFKKLLENVGLVALGGATIFAALVATAPDLV
ncbi:FHA domain protein [Diplocarpon rosae]|nr:FHA domain protein [Diplocarpon rosae]